MSLVYMKRVTSEIMHLNSDTDEMKIFWFINLIFSSQYEPKNIHTIPMDDILTLVESWMRSDCVYALKKKYFYQTTSHSNTVVFHVFITTF